MEVNIAYLEMNFIRGEMIMKKEERQVPYYGGYPINIGYPGYGSYPGYGYHHGHHRYGHGYYGHREVIEKSNNHIGGGRLLLLYSKIYIYQVLLS